LVICRARRFHAFAVGLIATLVLFPAVTRVRVRVLPPNVAGVHRSAEVPCTPQIVVPRDPVRITAAPPSRHPAERLCPPVPPATEVVRETAGLRAPPLAS
jgi:hypothetical protein